MSEEKKTYKTAARTRITEYLKNNSDKSVTVSDIQKHLCESGNETNISTVYRYLGRLCDEGVVNKYVADKGEMALYQYAKPLNSCNGHIHMQCRDCGRVMHLDCDFMDEIREHILKEHGFEIICKGSILFGLCDKCCKKTV